VAEDAVLPQRRVEQQAVPVPVLGDVADAGLARVARRQCGDVVAAEVIRARTSAWRMPMMASTSSVWPLPSTPAMPRTSPRWMVNVDVVEQRRASAVDERQRRRA
jgi:hypothetical protein